MSDKAMTMILELLQDAFEHAEIPSSFYEANKTITELGLNNNKIRACSNNCILYWGMEDENRQTCEACNKSILKSRTKGGETKASNDVNNMNKEICDKNTANWQKQTISHAIGSKTIARKKRELEIRIGQPYGRGKMYSMTHKRKYGSFANDEARQKSEQLDMQTKGTFSEDDAYTKVFRKKHPRPVRGMGFGVCPSQVIGSTCCSGGLTMSLSSGVPSNAKWQELKSKLQELKLELQESNARVQALEEQVTYLMQIFRGQLLPSFPNARVNQVIDLGSPVEARRSSSTSHEPQGHGPSSSPA